MSSKSTTNYTWEESVTGYETIMGTFVFTVKGSKIRC